jgi:phosphoribosylaminoimidazole (AIR) synthetase
MGVGMILVVPPISADDVLRTLRTAGETAWVLGTVEAGTRQVELR